jgi:predicted nucleic acid-binding protein
MDSCCFIELALQSIGKHEAGREDDLWFLKELLNAAFDEEIEVLTSTLTIAECSHAKGDVSEDVKTLFKKFLTSGRYVFLVQDSVLVAEKARNLRWVHGLAFGGADSIHLASALELKCDEFLTWDNKPHDNATELGNLALHIRRPHDTSCLPDSYRQQELITEPLALPPPVEVVEAEKLVPTDKPPSEKGE